MHATTMATNAEMFEKYPRQKGEVLSGLGGNSAMNISFVMPALNEEAVIGATLDSIRKHTGIGISYEIILVDHGSTDRTVEIAQCAGVRVFDSRGTTIAANRNYGASNSSGDVLVFLDADVRLTGDWGRNIEDTLSKLIEDEKFITGSHCGISEQPGWIEKCWFQPLAMERNSRHIGAGHLIIRRSLFDRLGGFDECLETGEDYEFSVRAKLQGAEIFNDSALRVIHEGFPNDLISFMRREAWHGLGDLNSLVSIFRSKVALGASLFVVLHLLLVCGVILIIASRQWLIFVTSVALIFLLLLASVIAKYPHVVIRDKLCALYLFYFYYWGRAWSFLKAVRNNTGSS